MIVSVKAKIATGMTTVKKTDPGSRQVLSRAHRTWASSSAAAPGRPGADARIERADGRATGSTGAAGAALLVFRRAGSQRKARVAITTPASPQAKSTPSAPRSHPEPGWNGVNWWRSASVKGLRGNTEAVADAHPGSSPTVNRPERKPRTTAPAMEAACATAADDATAATASPSAAKQATPTTSVTRVARAVRHTIWTS